MPSRELSNSEKRRMEAMKENFTLEFLCDQHLSGTFYKKGNSITVTAEQKALLEDREGVDKLFQFS